MRAIFLVLMWISPAIVAGALGWKGIWGGTSAFFDYIIPIPVAGGVFHVPSFVIAAAIMTSMKQYPASVARLVPLLAITVFLVAQTLQLDFERLHAWMFTDFDPARSPIRFGGFPLLLFIASDAIWLTIYSLVNGFVPRKRHVIAVLLLPLLIVGASAAMYKAGGPKFDYGYSRELPKRGNGMTLVYASSQYDEALFREWYESNDLVTRPWEWHGVENVALYFTSSMQDLKWHKVDIQDNVIATFCIYEEDRSVQMYSGHRDCFSGRVTLREIMNESFDSTDTGLGKEVNRWYAMAKLCEGMEIPDKNIQEIEIINLCRGLRSNFDRERKKIVNKYGEESPQVTYMDEKAGILGL